jgi:hypothetical protein
MGAPPEDEMERAYGTSTGTGLGTSLHPRIVTLERAPPQKERAYGTSLHQRMVPP